MPPVIGSRPSRRREALAVLVVSAAVLGLSTVLVSRHHSPFPGEVGLLETANDFPGWLGAVLEALMQFGNLEIGLIVIAIVAVLTAPRGMAPTVTVLLAALGAYRLDNIMKELVERPRPGLVLTTITVREPASGFAFPSGHSTAAFALAASLLWLLPGRWRWMPIGLASGAAVARLYVGVHWPVDLIGGAALGTLVGTSAWLAVDAAERFRRERETRSS